MVHPGCRRPLLDAILWRVEQPATFLPGQHFVPDWNFREQELPESKLWLRCYLAGRIRRSCRVWLRRIGRHRVWTL